MHVFLILVDNLLVDVPQQVVSLLALVLCAISGILVIIPINRTTTKFLTVVIIIPVAGNTCMCAYLDITNSSSFLVV